MLIISLVRRRDAANFHPLFSPNSELFLNHENCSINNKIEDQTWCSINHTITKNLKGTVLLLSNHFNLLIRQHNSFVKQSLSFPQSSNMFFLSWCCDCKFRRNEP